MSLIHELKEKLKLVFDDKKDLETEFLILKKNYIEMGHELDGEKLKVENLGLELINLTNAKKEIERELQMLTKNQNSESCRLKLLQDKLEARIAKEEELKLTVLNLQNEINVFRNQQRTLELDNEKLKMEAEGRRLDLEKGFLGMCKEREAQIRGLNQDLEKRFTNQRSDKIKYESQKRELLSKIKALQRRVGELEAQVVGLKKDNQRLREENVQINFKYDECRKIYRAKLFDFLQNEDNQEKYLNAREDLLHNYAEKEVDLLQQMAQLQKDRDDLLEQVELVTKYARECKYLAEDARLPGSVVPDILSRPFPRTKKEFVLRQYSHNFRGKAKHKNESGYNRKQVPNLSKMAKENLLMSNLAGNVMEEQKSAPVYTIPDQKTRTSTNDPMKQKLEYYEEMIQKLER